ncbi:hypothetical protein F3Y22_tig00110201pilonHSYRG00174 [Hibiscus syriacus]|uniref:Uncharacterized protein n=1 Tax=Hibiscus syriacus TaxID=106335 RepID=A0A6A3BAU3_HIBSY|nr:hypothetical protein F3Y22_tig00110201pilonHSYRG00174 [Hibiscus syriacus]
MDSQSIHELQKSNTDVVSDRPSSANNKPPCKSTEASLSCWSKCPQSLSNYEESAIDTVQASSSLNHAFRKIDYIDPKGSVQIKTTSSGEDLTVEQFISLSQRLSEAPQQGSGSNHADHCMLAANQLDGPELASSKQEPVSNNEEAGSSKEEFTPPSDHQSILVSLSTRCVWTGTVCERSHLFRIKYYGSSDKPLGRFLRDHLFDQSFHCHSCEMPSEAHVHCYTHRQGSLIIFVKKLPDPPLPGEREGKIWMWHRCLRCPRINGFPPATRRVVMSDAAAWGLSFGNFLELSFSNHAAASRVASCGHSLHRDCLRFYGFGRMVACFRYASINVHSVYLPPSKLKFNYDNQEWIQSEANEVSNRAEFLFTEVYNAL